MNPPNKEKILTVDDEPGIREMITEILTDDGYCVITAADGEEGIATAMKEQPDLILMDIRMPNMDGLEASRRLRANPFTAKIPIVILTAYNSRDRLEDSMGSGADDFLGKPISLIELKVRVRAMLNAKNITDEVERLQEYINSMKTLRGQLSSSQDL